MQIALHTPQVISGSQFQSCTCYTHYAERRTLTCPSAVVTLAMLNLVAPGSQTLRKASTKRQSALPADAKCLTNRA